MIYYNNLFFRTGSLDINNFDFLKGFDTLYDLSTDLLNEIINTLQAAEEQNEMIEIINEPGKFILPEEESIKEK